MNYRELQVFRQNEIDVRVGGTVLAWRYAYAQMVRAYGHRKNDFYVGHDF